MVDLLVVGMGQAGLSAALTASGYGLSVACVDDNPAVGGQITRAKLGQLEPLVASIYERLLERKVELYLSEPVFDLPQPGVARTTARDIAFKNLLIATGSRELFLPFPGWTLPGVFGAGGLQALYKSGLDLRGKKIVVSGSGPLLLPVAHTLRRAGAKVFGPFEQADQASLMLFAAAAGKAGKAAQMSTFATTMLKYRMGRWVTSAEGDERLRSVQLNDGKRIDCDYLACSYGLVPNTELARLAGCEIAEGFVKVDDMQRTSVENVFCAGEPTGIRGNDSAVTEGRIAVLAVVGSSDGLGVLQAKARTQREFAAAMARTFRPNPEILKLAKAETIVCRCEDVTLSQLTSNSTGRDAKLQTRCGMGPCQGRVCGPIIQTLLGWEPDSVRPPVTTVPLGRLATGAEADYLP